MSAIAEYTWWITIRLEPQNTYYHEIPSESLSPPLKRITIFDCNSPAPTFSEVQCSDVRKNKAQFEISGDFNNDNKIDIARVGVAEELDSSLVGVLLIGPAEESSAHQIFTYPDNGFSALYLDEGILKWYQCME